METTTEQFKPQQVKKSSEFFLLPFSICEVGIVTTIFLIWIYFQIQFKFLSNDHEIYFVKEILLIQWDELMKFIPAWTIYFISSFCLRKCFSNNLELDSLLMVPVSAMSIGMAFGWETLAIITLILLLCLPFVLLRSKFCIWILALFLFFTSDKQICSYSLWSMCFKKLPYPLNLMKYWNGYNSYFMCRMILIGLDLCDRKTNSKKMWICSLRYYYFPLTFHTGSMISSHNFIKQLENRNAKLPPIIYLLQHSCQILCFSILFYFIDFHLNPEKAAHFVKKHVDFTPIFFVGAGLFYLYHYVYYETARLCCLADGIVIYPKPACLYRLYFFSELAREFDRGMAFFIKEYIYMPIIKEKPNSNKRKIVGAAASFSFVCLFHGLTYDNKSWAFVNFLLIQMENVISKIICGPTMKGFVWQYFSPQWKRRVGTVVLATCFLLYTSLNANFIWICSLDKIFKHTRSFRGCTMYFISNLPIFYILTNISIFYKHSKAVKEKMN